jgi:hypothetical protein
MCVFVGFSYIFLLGILIFKGLTARRLYKSFGVKGLLKLDSTRSEMFLVAGFCEYGYALRTYIKVLDKRL